MILSEYTLFVELWDSLAATKLHRSFRADDRERSISAYWDHLRAYPIAGVRVAWQRLRDQDGKFPTSSQWACAIPWTARPDAPVMSWGESAEYDRAAAVGYEREPCQCWACVEAGADTLPQRYLPEEDPQTGDARKAQHPRTLLVVYPGQWAHGQALAGWHLAREHFYATAHKLFGITRRDLATCGVSAGDEVRRHQTARRVHDEH